MFGVYTCIGLINANSSDGPEAAAGGPCVQHLGGGAQQANHLGRRPQDHPKVLLLAHPE